MSAIDGAIERRALQLPQLDHARCGKWRTQLVA
jgi:hypothetical protein